MNRVVRNDLNVYPAYAMCTYAHAAVRATDVRAPFG